MSISAVTSIGHGGPPIRSAEALMVRVGPHGRVVFHVRDLLEFARYAPGSVVGAALGQVVARQARHQSETAEGVTTVLAQAGRHCDRRLFGCRVVPVVHWLGQIKAEWTGYTDEWTIQ